MNLSLKDGSSLLRYALERGIDFLDTAQYYETYPYIKEALKDGRYQPVIASKSLEPTYNGMKAAIEEARREMDRDFIDIFLLHEVRNEPDWTNRLGAWEYLQEAKSKGIVKAIGLSTHHVEVTEQAAFNKDMDVIFPLINFRSLGIRYGTGPGLKEDMAAAIKLAADSGKGIFVMKVFGGGNLTGHYLKALHYIQNLEGISSMMIGFGHTDEIDRIIEVIEGTIDPHYIPDTSLKKIRIDQGDCEGCGACIKRCPNHAIKRNDAGLAQVNHDICLTCGYCAPVCPVRAIIMF
ncbi:aldo/keto reductase [Clostridiales bacterium BAD-6]|uniref:Aldo/keto reductase n=1 Tax=Sinanaerobacter chloroacetimidivorans TaxID=2818044 RepID=A0A8J7VZP5_9FIRM|nr:aldo/keto reductase [Sinanaerobacter chloroacetimidivorans]